MRSKRFKIKKRISRKFKGGVKKNTKSKEEPESEANSLQEELDASNAHSNNEPHSSPEEHSSNDENQSDVLRLHLSQNPLPDNLDNFTGVNITGRCLKIGTTPMFLLDGSALVSSSLTQLIKDLDNLIKGTEAPLLPPNFSGRSPPPNRVRDFTRRLIRYYRLTPSNRKKIRQLIGIKLASDASEPYMTQIWINLNLRNISKECGIPLKTLKRFGLENEDDSNGTIVELDEDGTYHSGDLLAAIPERSFLTRTTPVTKLLFMSVSNDKEHPRFLMVSGLTILSTWGNTLNTSTMAMDTVHVLATAIDLIIKSLKKIRDHPNTDPTLLEKINQGIDFLEEKRDATTEEDYFNLEESLRFLSDCNIKGVIFSNPNGTHKVVLYGNEEFMDLTGIRHENKLYKLACKATEKYVLNLTGIKINIDTTNGICKQEFMTPFLRQLLGMNMEVWMESNPFDILTDALFGSLEDAHDLKWMDSKFIEKLSWRKKFGINTGNSRMANVLSNPKHALLVERDGKTRFIVVDGIYTLSDRYKTPDLNIGLSHSEGSETLRPVTPFAACAQTSEDRLARSSFRLIAMYGKPFYEMLGSRMQVTSDSVVIHTDNYTRRKKGEILLKELGIKNKKQLSALKSFFKSLESSRTLVQLLEHPSILLFKRILEESQTISQFTDLFTENIAELVNILLFPLLTISISEITAKIKHDSLVEEISQIVSNSKEEFRVRELTKEELDEIKYAASYVESIPDESRSTENIIVFGIKIPVSNFSRNVETSSLELTDEVELTDEEVAFIQSEVTVLETEKINQDFIDDELTKDVSQGNSEKITIDNSDESPSSKRMMTDPSTGSDALLIAISNLETVLQDTTLPDEKKREIESMIKQMKIVYGKPTIEPRFESHLEDLPEDDDHFDNFTTEELSALMNSLKDTGSSEDEELNGAVGLPSPPNESARVWPPRISSENENTQKAIELSRGPNPKDEFLKWYSDAGLYYKSKDRDKLLEVVNKIEMRLPLISNQFTEDDLHHIQRTLVQFNTFINGD